MDGVYNIREDYETWMRSRAVEKTLQSNLRASTVGFACDRHHYHALTEYRDPPGVGLQAIYDEGALHEKDVEKKLRDMGYEVEGAQRNYRIEKPLVTIHIDGMLRKNGGPWYPYDAKTISPWGYDQMNSAEDFIGSKKHYHRSYVTQILAYMYATNAQYGCLILKNKQTGQVKDVWLSFDEHVSFLNEAFKRAERVYEAVAKKEPPARTDDMDLCLQCDFRHVCLPDLKFSPGVKVIEGEEVAKKLSRLEELKPLKKEYEEIDGEVKDAFKQAGVGEYVTSDWLVRVKEQKRGAYQVPESSFLVTKYVKMNGGAE